MRQSLILILCICLSTFVNGQISYPNDEDPAVAWSARYLADNKPKKTQKDDLLILDLSKINDSSTYQLDAGKNYTIKVIGFLPFKLRDYNIEVKIETKSIPAFLSNDFKLKDGKTEYFNISDSIKFKLDSTFLKNVDSLNNLIIDCDDEAKLPFLIERLKSKVGLISEKQLENSHEIIKEAFRIIKASYYAFESQINDTKYNQLINVTIKRINKSGQLFVWKKKYETPTRGEWKTNYGFSFVSNVFSKEYPYFTKQLGIDSFQIKEGAKNKFWNFYPTVMFTWYPARFNTANFSSGLSVGLGYDLSNISVFTGYSLTYNQNFTLALGVAVHKQKVLNEKYAINENIKENLSEDQLTVGRIKFNPFVSFIFRFDKSPFTGTSQ